MDFFFAFKTLNDALKNIGLFSHFNRKIRRTAERYTRKVYTEELSYCLSNSLRKSSLDFGFSLPAAAAADFFSKAVGIIGDSFCLTSPLASCLLPDPRLELALFPVPSGFSPDRAKLGSVAVGFFFGGGDEIATVIVNPSITC